MFVLRRLILIGLAASCAATSAAPKTRDRRLSEYILTFDQFNNIDLPERVEYIKFLGRFLAAVEDAQKGPVDKTKTAKLLQKFMELAMSQAYAEANYDKSGDGIAGQTCIHSFAVSEYVKNKNGVWVCKPPETSSQCGSGETGCGDQLYKMAKQIPGQQGLKGLCAPKDFKHRTDNCWKKFVKIGGKKLEQAIAGHVDEIYKSPEERKQFSQFSALAKATLEEFQNQSIGGGLTIREYCQLNGKDRGKNSLNGGLQDEECKTIVAAVDTFAPATGLPEKVNVDPANVEPAAADVPAAKTQKPADTGESDLFTEKNTTVAYKKHAKDEVTEVVPEPQGEPKDEPKKANQEKAPQADEPDAQAAPEKAKAPKNLGPLDCVAKGLAKQLGSSSASYGNWVALMGVIVQKQSGNDHYTSEGDAAAFQSKVIDAIGSFGYCRDVTYPIDVASDGNINDWITGKKDPSDEAVAKSFGITSKYSKSVISDLFDVDPNSTLADRNSNFKTKAGLYADKFGTTPFSKCAEKMAGLKDMRFNFVCNKATKTYSETATQKNTEFRNGLAAACKGVHPFKNPPPQACDAGVEDEPATQPADEEPAPAHVKKSGKKTSPAPVKSTKTKRVKTYNSTISRCQVASSYWACEKINRGKKCFCEQHEGANNSHGGSNNGGGHNGGGHNGGNDNGHEKGEASHDRSHGEPSEGGTGRGAGGGSAGGIH
jgi:hypothetical protein